MLRPTLKAMKSSMSGLKNSKGTTSVKKDSGMIVNEETKTNSLSGSEQPSTWVSKPDEMPLIDDAFSVKKQRWGTFVSYTVDKKPLITSLTEEICISATRWYLKGLQDNSFEYNEGVSYSGEVGGKL